MISKHGIVYDLKISPYILQINEITYYFSSQLHLLKFQNKLSSNRELTKAYLSKKFKMHVKWNTLADLYLYTLIETRGFYIKIKEVEYTCPECIKCVGTKMTMTPLEKQ